MTIRSPGRRSPATAIVVALLTATVSAVTSMPSATAAPPGHDAPVVAVPRIDWSPCDDGLSCARVNVPLDYDKPSGETISIALNKLPATDPARRIGSLFVNPGGPGGS